MLFISESSFVIFSHFLISEYWYMFALNALNGGGHHFLGKRWTLTVTLKVDARKYRTDHRGLISEIMPSCGVIATAVVIHRGAVVVVKRHGGTLPLRISTPKRMTIGIYIISITISERKQIPKKIFLRRHGGLVISRVSLRWQYWWCSVWRCECAWGSRAKPSIWRRYMLINQCRTDGIRWGEWPYSIWNRWSSDLHLLPNKICCECITAYFHRFQSESTRRRVDSAHILSNYFVECQCVWVRIDFVKYK